MRKLLGFGLVVILGFGGTAASTLGVTPAPNAYGWNKEPVTITISGTPPLYWQVNGMPASSATSPVSFVISEEGVHVVRYRDSTESDYKTAVVRLDFTPPEIQIRVPTPDGKYILNQPVHADWSVWDWLSGVAKVEASAGRGELVDTRSPGQARFIVRAEDRAGNKSQALVVYFVHGMIQAVLPSGFYLDHILPPEQRVRVGKHLVQARYIQGEDVAFAFVMKDYFGQVFTRAAAEISVVRVRFVDEKEEYPLVKWLRVPFDVEKGYYFVSVSTKDFESGYYDLWVLFGDGQFELLRIEVLPKS